MKIGSKCPRCTAYYAAAGLTGGIVVADEYASSGVCCDTCGFVPAPKCDCGGVMRRSSGCGVRVCDRCEKHQGLARCYCGWAASGGNGLQELQEMGENCDEDY